MEFQFGVVNTIATAFTISITILNVIVYKLRQIQEANLGDITTPSQLPDEDLRESSSSPSSSGQSCRHFSLGEILVATNNFDDTLVIGHGGFGKVYKGVIDNGLVTVAIKRLNPMSRQGAPQFWTEVDLLSRFRHSHLVSLVGYCYNTHEMILVYEYMPRGSLADHLYKNQSNLTWIQRLKICIGAGQGLDYLHTGTGINDRVIHRDMKSSNILLDESWAAKVSDFGLSKIGPANQDLTQVSTNIKGTHGFLDPEYIATHRLTRKSDVYSFGVVLLEVLSGKRAMDPKICEEHWDLVLWAEKCIRNKEVEQFIDPCLKHEILRDSLKEFVQIAEKCLQYRSRKRPSMAEVVASLEHVLALQERVDSTMLDEDFMNLGWAATNNQENLDDSAVQRNEREVIHDNVLSGDANLQSRVRRPTARIMPFKRMARFFFGKSRVDSEYDFDTIKAATNNFSLKLGEGGYGAVYKGVLPNGQEIAVKKYIYKESRVESDFRKEISLFAKLQHRNLVCLLGFCSKGITERLLIYEFVPNLSLDNYIYANPLMRGRSLDWVVCKKIIRGVSKAIIYLHEDSPERIIHCNLKPENILLDSEMNPKISDFGLAVSCLGVESGMSLTSIRGTVWYMAPEYFQTRRISVKTDVYSFGILVLNIISGLKACFDATDGTIELLLHVYAMRNWREGIFWDIVISPHLSESGSEVIEEIKRCIHIALLCIQYDEVLRPTMSEVLSMLNNPSLSLPEPSLYLPEPSSMPISIEYDFNTIKAVTNNFSLKLDEDGFGAVYKGVLPNGLEIAVKKFSCNSGEAESEFRNEIFLLAKLQHKNLVRLLGFCSKGITERLLIYEFNPNLSLENYINDPLTRRRSLDWEVCRKIIRGVSMGIIYLHEDCSGRIIHRDLKPKNILLDSEMNPKISDFGLAVSCLGVESGMSVSRICGTYEYLLYTAPEYAMIGRISVKTDVYSFGSLVLHIISGRKAYSYASDGTIERLQDYAKQNWSEGIFWDILISPHLSESGSEVIMEIKRCIHIALLCTEEDEVSRPTMSQVLSMLNNPSQSLPEPSFPTSSSMPTFFINDMPSDDLPVNEDDLPNNLCYSYNEDWSSYSGNEDSASELSPR